MIEIVIPEQHYHDLFDEENETFLPPVDIKETRIQIEHSLISLKKWEQKWNKPFLGEEDKTYEEIIDYIHCMTLTHGVDPIIYNYIPKNTLESVIKYIKDPMTATTITQKNIVDSQIKSKEGITAEIIYYWMIALSIPVEFEKWHLNQLLTLIRVVSIKNGGDKKNKVDKRTAARERAALNAKRRAKYNSKG